MWEQLKIALEQEYAFEKQMFQDPKWHYHKLCEGEIQDLGHGPIEMVWLHLKAVHDGIRALMIRMEAGEDTEVLLRVFEQMKEK